MKSLNRTLRDHKDLDGLAGGAGHVQSRAGTPEDDGVGVAHGAAPFVCGWAVYTE